MMTPSKLAVSIVLEALDKVSKPINEVKGSISNLQNAVTKASGTFNRGMKNAAMASLAGDAVNRLKDQTLGLLQPAIAVGIEFEAAMSAVRANAGGTAEDFSKLTTEARRLGATTSFSATQAAEGMNELAKAGFNTNEIIEAMPGLLDLSKASGMGLASATTIAADTMAQFGLKAKDMSEIADVLAYAANSSTIGVQELGETFKYTAAVGKSAGLTLQEVAAFTALLGNAGSKGSVAGTSMAKIITSLANPKDTAIKALRTLGVETTKMVNGQKVIRSYPEMIGEIAQSLQKFGNADKLGMISDIFGKDASVLAAMSSLTDLPPEKLNEMLAKMQEGAKGKAAEIGKIMSDNIQGSLDELSSAQDEFKLTVFDQIKEPLKTVIQLGTKALTLFTNFAKDYPGVTKVIVISIAALGALAAVIAPIIFLIGGLMSIVTTISAGWTIMVAALAVLKAMFLLASTAVWSFTAALLANPITWIVLAVAALAAGLWWLYKNFDMVKQGFIDLWNGSELFRYSLIGLAAIAGIAFAPVIGSIALITAAVYGLYKLWQYLKPSLPSWLGGDKQATAPPSGVMAGAGSSGLGFNMAAAGQPANLNQKLQNNNSTNTNIEKNQLEIKIPQAPAGTTVTGGKGKGVSLDMGFMNSPG
jgi:TP901 family phage tail tape measure protein